MTRGFHSLAHEIMSKTTRKKWIMPDWMEPYRQTFQNTGGNSIEELMNNHEDDAFNNVVLAGLIVSVDSQVTLLSRLKQAGVLPNLSGVIKWDGKKWKVEPEPESVASTKGEA